MKRSQLIVLWSTIIVLVICCLVPPWTETHQHSGISRVYTPKGYALIFTPPSASSSGRGVIVDIDRIVLQAVIILALGGGVLATVSRKMENRVRRASAESAIESSPLGQPPSDRSTSRRRVVKFVVFLCFASLFAVGGFLIRPLLAPQKVEPVAISYEHLVLQSEHDKLKAILREMVAKPWLQRRFWAEISSGMTDGEVKGILGEPHKTMDLINKLEFTYMNTATISGGNGGIGRVNFDRDYGTNTWRVRSTDTSPSYFEPSPQEGNNILHAPK